MFVVYTCNMFKIRIVAEYLLFIMLWFFATSGTIYSKDNLSIGVISLVKLKQENLTRNKIISIIGKPTEIDETWKKEKWYYKHGNISVVIHWGSNSNEVKKIVFETVEKTNNTSFDYSLPDKLKTGITDVSEAIKIFGMPNDMTLKPSTQEMHYTYENSKLRLFFRNKKFVDFALY